MALYRYCEVLVHSSTWSWRCRDSGLLAGLRFGIYSNTHKVDSSRQYNYIKNYVYDAVAVA